MNASRAALFLALLASPAAADDAFERHVRPLLVARCVKCHGPAKQSGGLRLDSRAAAIKGGDGGAAAVPGKPAESQMILALSHKGDVRMPPSGKLSDAEITHLRDWVARGMPWPATAPVVGGGTAASEEHRRWWAYRPLVRSTPPAVKSASALADIDRYLLAKLEAKGLTFAPPADRRTLVRRLSYGLTGMPPSADEVEAFLGDRRGDAYERQVDRLLASPRHGEKWGRHWLDLVRYADTAGENSDHPVRDAWKYRNWVIDAVNDDAPYDRFVREQLAGDILADKSAPERRESLTVATGFLALARRFDHDIDKHMHLTYEDIIDTTGRAFLGQSIGCARCHDHKYDPFTARDYYALYGVFSSTTFPYPGCEFKPRPRGLVSLTTTAEKAAVFEPHRKKVEAAEREAGNLTAAIDKHAKAVLDAIRDRATRLAAGEIPDGGSATFAATATLKAGEVLRLTVRPGKSHGADSTLVEWKITEAGGSAKSWDLTTDALRIFGKPPFATDTGPWAFLDGAAGHRPFSTPFVNIDGGVGVNGAHNSHVPSVFVNAAERPTKVWSILPARSFFVHPGAAEPAVVTWAAPSDLVVTMTGKVADAHPGGPDGVAWAVEKIGAAVGPDIAAMADAHRRRRDAVKVRDDLRANAPRERNAYAVRDGGAGDARLHLRGDPEKLGPVVPRRWPEFLGGQPLGAKTTSGRLDLAERIVDPKSPLAARVFVNRVWQHHFGRGIVATPNDFGTRGELPSHPELLDRLADDFVRDGWNIKRLHRRIVLSAAYRQSATASDEALSLDPNNVLLGRFERRRLSAEEIRDALLVAGGNLDGTPGGEHPLPPESSWNFTQHVPFGTFYDHDKRSVYLINVRNRRHPFLGLFDGADPNTTTAARRPTTVPTQALWFMNDPFVHRQSESLAARVSAQKTDDERLSALFRAALQRSPTQHERERAAAFRAAYSAELTGDRERQTWAALARVVLSGNEFLYAE